MHIDLKTAIDTRDMDFSNDNEVLLVARAYVEVPLSWDESYRYSNDTIAKNKLWLLERKSDLKVITCWHNDDLVGLHILHIVESGLSKDCFIRTLWVSPKFRRAGLGRRLKDLGETWARTQGAEKIVTNVHLKNKRMIEINEKLGFAPHRIEFHKTLT